MLGGRLLYREALCSALADAFDVVPTGWTEGLVHSGDQIRRCGIRLIIVDLTEPPCAQPAVDLEEFRAVYPFCRCVAIVAGQDELLVRSLLCVPVSGIVEAGEPLGDLRRALAAAAKGQSFVSPLLGSSLIGMGEIEPLRSQAETSLSARQREILELERMGWKRGDIARKLCISPETVYTHSRRIREKLVQGHSRHGGK